MRWEEAGADEPHQRISEERCVMVGRFAAQLAAEWVAKKRAVRRRGEAAVLAVRMMRMMMRAAVLAVLAAS